MSARLVSIALLAVLAIATPVVKRDGECDTGPIQCCQSMQTVDEYNANPSYEGLLAVVLGEGNVGLGCSPMSLVGLGSTGCTQAPVCCSNNTYNGLINIGCTPITIL